ncbi:ABC transporter permease [Arthrobacter roseus]|uniref:ABC transporter permease n=1 Tax=Arthrobacter roseus TaxID=136274 RepID=UPI0019630220|nr:ABC transporter permease [Arthrobacter roseus]MBM7847640.1 ABC-2 type transport system permease protein [Arthrobacter roseus]
MSTITAPSASSRITAIAGQELKIIVRNKTVLAGAVVMPFLFAGFVAFAGPGKEAPAFTLGLTTLMVVMLAVYVTVVTTFATRRQELFLKRLRSGESSDSIILAGMTAPVAALTLAQLLVVFIVVFATGFGLPPNPWPVVVGVVLIIVSSTAFGILTSIYTPSASAAQFTTLPYFMLVMGTFVWPLFATDPALQTLQALTPGGAMYQLFQAGWGGEVGLLPFISLIGLWTYLPLHYAMKNFTWDKR